MRNMATVQVGGLWMSLRQTRGGYTLLFGILTEPDKVSITHLGNDRQHAIEIFCRKVHCHQLLVGDVTTEAI